MNNHIWNPYQNKTNKTTEKYKKIMAKVKNKQKKIYIR